ncbi:MAG: hypothetical protein GKC10_09600 [Methanosarcinales archaeon]|nr:hypothetical protein [Methanosarcinales archaeon]
MNGRRLQISVALGLLFGLLCAYGSANSVPGLSLPILASIFYDRLLLGLAVGMAEGIDLHPLIRGSAIGLVVSLVIAIPAGYYGGALLLAAGLVYGAVIDLAATRFS